MFKHGARISPRSSFVRTLCGLIFPLFLLTACGGGSGSAPRLLEAFDDPTLSDTGLPADSEGLPTLIADTATETSVVIETSFGEIQLQMDSENAPNTVANFLEYVDAGHYDQTIFHRVIPGFMIQGGGFSPDFQRNATRPPILNEANNGLANDRYTIAMARTPLAHSATCLLYTSPSRRDLSTSRMPSSA